MLTLNAVSNSRTTLETRRNLDRVYFRKDGYLDYKRQGKQLANS